MSSPVSLILGVTPVYEGWRRAAVPPRPHAAVVYVNELNELIYFGGRAGTHGELRRGRRWTRYDVDTGDHSRTLGLVSTPLLARGDAYAFEAVVNVKFRVADPPTVVRRNVEDPLRVIGHSLAEWFRPITRGYDITESQAAEQRINADGRFGNTMLDEEGILIVSCVAHLRPDGAGQRHIRMLEEARRSEELGRSTHVVDIQRTVHDQEIQSIEQTGRLGREQVEVQALGDLPETTQGAAILHVARNPGETAALLNAHLHLETGRAEMDDRAADRTANFFTNLANAGILHAGHLLNPDGGLANLQSPVAGIAQGPGARGPRAAGASGWDDDLPGGGQRSNPADTGTAPALPVYLAIDESPQDPDYADALDEGVADLLAALAVDPRVAATLRLSILGFGARAQVRMPMTAVADDGFLPRFASGGPADLSQLFDQLYQRVGRDLDTLKAGGMKVGRPALYLLYVSAQTGAASWTEAHRRLTDRAGFRYAPDIVVCGGASADPRTVAALAHRPEAGFVAPSGMPAPEAARRYLDHLGTAIAARAVAHSEHRSEALLSPPPGFRTAARVVNGEYDA